MVLQILCSLTNPELMINASALLLWVSTRLCPCLLRACPCLPSCLLNRHSAQRRRRASAAAHAGVKRHMAFPQCTCRGKKKRSFSWSRQGRWLTTLRWKKNTFYCFAWNLAWSFKVSFKYRTLHCAGLELPKLLMDSGGLDTARKDLPRQQKAENHFLGEGTYHQQCPHTAPRSSFSCFLLLKGFFAAVLQGMGLQKCRTTAASRVGKHRIWSCVLILSREVLSTS